MSADMDDKDKQIQELTLKVEIEKQKFRKLEQEVEILKQKLEKSKASSRDGGIPGGLKPPPRASGKPTTERFAGQPSPGSGTDLTHFIDQDLKDSVSGVEVSELRTKLDTLNERYKVAEREKWDIARQNIEFKEQLQRLKVKGINLKKDIENLNEKLDRKENQNFKSRLEIADLKKEQKTSDEFADESQNKRENLESQIAAIEDRIEKERIKLKEEKRVRDMVHAEYQRNRDMLNEYESHPAARIYNR